MFQRFIDDFRDSTGNALRLNIGPIEACLAGASIFFVATLIVASLYMVRKDRIEARAARAAERAAENAKSAMHSALADPMMVAAGLQVIRAIGIKKLIPILAVGGIALGFLASRNTQPNQTPAE
jgi:ABC-type methionine transport system permease subunit